MHHGGRPAAGVVDGDRTTPSTRAETMTHPTTTVPRQGGRRPLLPLEDAGRASLFTDARTANRFTDEPVSDAELAELWELARWAPTSANTQPLRVLFVRTDEGRARLAPHMADGNRARVEGAPAVAVLAVDRRFHDRIPEVMPPMAGLRDVLEADPERRQGMAGFSAAMQAGYVVLAARAVGLGAGPLAGFDADGVDAELFAGTSWHAVLVVTLGHPDEGSYRPRMPRLAAEDVVRWA
ncbi:3-hydroxypropanoate dehydrogenase [Pseudokineococcus lusitanus]|uniref:3-hydroxypropanoate dehydrogenase n=2 Tax=Pseudokineococcus lusitanus TaxID=763993 RepID=A0A3N1HQD7_9ACTN|nr:3-hydroxypropanoate dehydrogenase [Pseudokineococcus lusitanus]